ncbi:MAG: hypothetical protein GY757_40845 [bacterium]|nr:hypothetical protein [bacterium]
MKNIHMATLLMVTLLSLTLAAFAASPLPSHKIEGVPEGGHILVNGIFEDLEWNDALKKDLDENLKLILKQDKQYIYIGIRFMKVKHTGIDFFLSDSKGNRVMMHISSALSESRWDGTKWMESTWGLNRLWSGNVTCLYIADGKRRVVEPDGFEFQIDKKMLPGKSWSLMMKLKRPSKTFPEKAVDSDTVHWFNLKK